MQGGGQARRLRGSERAQGSYCFAQQGDEKRRGRRSIKRRRSRERRASARRAASDQAALVGVCAQGAAEGLGKGLERDTGAAPREDGADGAQRGGTGYPEARRVARRAGFSGDWVQWVLRGGVGDEQRQALAAGALVVVAGAEAMVVRGKEGSALSEEACRALGVPRGSRWGVGGGHSRGAVGYEEGRSAGNVDAQVRFDEAADDAELLRHVFINIDTDGNERISMAELDAALSTSTANQDLVNALKMTIEEKGGEIKFDVFKEGAGQVHESPRASSQLRFKFKRSLGSVWGAGAAGQGGAGAVGAQARAGGPAGEAPAAGQLQRPAERH